MRTELRPFCVGILGLVVLTSSAAAAEIRLRLQDETGAVLTSAIELCVQTRSSTSCDTYAAGATPTIRADALSLRIEGEDYGPLQLQATELAGPSGFVDVKVAKKCPLALEGPEDGPLSVSLYHPASPDFRTPAFRKELKAVSDRLKIPAGDFVLSLSRPGRAPDLHHISASKGAPVRIRYRPTTGWSLVLRCVTADRSPAPKTAVALWDTPGFDAQQKEIARSECAAGGLALFSGLDTVTVAATGNAKGFLTGRVDGITASPATFAFKELVLPRGGRLSATVSQQGHAVTSAQCVLAELRLATRIPYHEVWRGKTDQEGRCRSTTLQEGRYRLQISLAESRAVSTRWSQAVEGQEVNEDIVLAPATVRGHVRRGADAVPGYTVEAAYMSNVRPASAPADIAAKAETAEDGAYELTLWDPGDYYLLLRTPEGSFTSGRKKVSIAESDETKVDFELGANSISGIVVDRETKPIEGAMVALEVGQSLRVAQSNAEGLFHFDLTEPPASAKVSATRVGFRDSAIQTVPLGGDAAPAVKIVLERADKLQGIVVSAGGTPVAGALVTTLVTTPDGPDAYRSVRAGTDARFEIDLAPDSTIGFISGRGCPLTPFHVDSVATSQPLRVACAPTPANIVLTVRDQVGNPLPFLGLILRTGSILIPEGALRAHLSAVGVPALTDGAGRLAILNIAPGTYEIYSSAQTSTGLIATSPEKGFLTKVGVGPLETLDAQVTVSTTE